MAGLVDFTNEEEVKEYLTNTEIEFMFGCHKEHSEDSCYRLGEFLETIRKKFGEAATVYKNCCEKFGNAPCCYKAGQYHMLGKGGLEKSELEAFKCYHKACKQKNYSDQGKNDRIAAACCNKGLLLYPDNQARSEILKHLKESENVTTDKRYLYSEIAASFERACTLNDKAGCNFLSHLYMTGFEDKVKPDQKIAAKFAEKSCELGEASACHNLSIMYSRGDGVGKDVSKSAEFAKRRDELIKGSTSLKFSEH